MRSWLGAMPCSPSQPLICSGDQRCSRSRRSMVRRKVAVSLRGLLRTARRASALACACEPVAALPTIATQFAAHRALADAKQFSDPLLAAAALVQRINLTTILSCDPPVLLHR